tara:strand:+ start:104 stop:517 length:414 start_codon:yes stop_codon:yes gene_type:complete
MIIVYTPQLENPPRDKEVSLGFSIIGERPGITKRVTLKSGVNRDVPDSDWEQIKGMPLVGELLSLGALQVQQDVEVVTTPTGQATGGLETMPVKEALNAIHGTFDLDLLSEWDRAENRVRIKNAIAKRVKAITEGEG